MSESGRPPDRRESAVQLEPGVRLGKYELLCVLARGGMGAIWLGRSGGGESADGGEGSDDPERLVAIKTILPDLAVERRFQDMFLDETRIASRVVHPNVARVIDTGEVGDVLYYVMELIDGDSLRRALRTLSALGEPFPLPIALRVLADTAAGLHAAHELRSDDGEFLHVIHRDISPQNILLTTDGVTKIIDFGIAKARGRVSGDTSAGGVKGKVEYMAPEQAMGKPIDRRVDVWAVGAILFGIVTGKSPYEAKNHVARFQRLFSGEPVDPIPDSVPEPVRHVITRALQVRVEDRFPTALELQKGLEDAISALGPPVTPQDLAAFYAKYMMEHEGARRGTMEIALKAADERRRLLRQLMPNDLRRDKTTDLSDSSASWPAFGRTADAQRGAESAPPRKDIVNSNSPPKPRPAAGMPVAPPRPAAGAKPTPSVAPTSGAIPSVAKHDDGWDEERTVQISSPLAKELVDRASKADIETDGPPPSANLPSTVPPPSRKRESDVTKLAPSVSVRKPPVIDDGDDEPTRMAQSIATPDDDARTTPVPSNGKAPVVDAISGPNSGANTEPPSRTAPLARADESQSPKIILGILVAIIVVLVGMVVAMSRQH
ncbi:MAG: protein kinase [Polyangiaceae bacterium]